MIGQNLRHPCGVAGIVDADAVHPDGQALARINDHWFFAADLVANDEAPDETHGD